MNFPFKVTECGKTKPRSNSSHSLGLQLNFASFLIPVPIRVPSISRGMSFLSERVSLLAVGVTCIMALLSSRSAPTNCARGHGRTANSNLRDLRYEEVLIQAMDCAFCFAHESVGGSKPASSAMIAMTTSSSMSVKPRAEFEIRILSSEIRNKHEIRSPKCPMRRWGRREGHSVLRTGFLWDARKFGISR